MLLFHKIPITFHTFLPILYKLQYAATVEVHCSLLQHVFTASWTTTLFL
jgi:hypothetical protein